MTSIHFNHLALVEAPRVPDAVIGDALPSLDIKKMADSLQNLISERMAFLKNPSGVSPGDFNQAWLAKLDEALTGEQQDDTGAMDGRRMPGAGWRSGPEKLSGVLAPLSRIKVLG